MYIFCRYSRVLLFCFFSALNNQAIASSWDDQINQWKKESLTLKESDIPQLETQARAGDVRAAYLLYTESDNHRFQYSKRDSTNAMN